MPTQFEKIFDSKFLIDIVDRLTIACYNNAINENRKPDLTDYDIHKSIWLTSILAQSSDEIHLQFAQDFASLLYLNYSGRVEIQQLAYTIYSRSGNLVAAKFLDKIGDEVDNKFLFSKEFGSLLNLELSVERNRRSFGSGGIVLSDFQSNLLLNIDINKNVSVSAPTSAGKSFIIQEYLERQFITNDKILVLYIVPSKALLSQVSEQFRSRLTNDIEIHTSFIFDKNNKLDEIRKHLLILTPERCLRLLQYGWSYQLDLDVLFVDEIQNVEENQGRGILLEYILNEISQKWPNCRKIIAGPMIKRPDYIFEELFGTKGIPVESKKSPVVQIKTIVSVEDKDTISLELVSRHDSSTSQNLSIAAPFNLKREFDKGIGPGISILADFITKKGQSIIYAPKTDYVQNWAISHANHLSNKTTNNDLLGLIEFLKDEIHPKYFLIRCLEYEIAFHHAKLPDIVRKEIENLFSAGVIKFLYCTSTLLEGVNLPANNLFIVLPQKRTEPLTPFEFGNLIGRAGRIRDSLYGTIYCVEREGRKWAQKYYSTNAEKSLHTSTRKSLEKPDSFLKNSSNVSTDIKDPGIRSSLTFLRHKFLKDKDEYTKYLQDRVIDSSLRDKITRSIEISTAGITIPYEVLRLNPSIDPLLQQRLYAEMTKEGIDEWIFHFNDNFYKRISGIKNAAYTHKTTSLFWQLYKILDKLNGVFAFGKELYLRHGIKSLSIGSTCSYATQWLENKSFKELIKADLDFHANHHNEKKRIDPNDEKVVNERINEVIKIHSTVISFVLVKYLKVVNDLLILFTDNIEDERFRFSLSMPVMLELGTTKRNVILLMSRGINRSVALKVNKEFEKVPGHEEIDIFQWLKSIDNLPLKNIYNKYLRMMNMFKSPN